MTIMPLRRLVGRQLRRATTRDSAIPRHPVSPARRGYHDAFFADPAIVEDDYRRMRRRSGTSR
jgi:hypothetical protein